MQSIFKRKKHKRNSMVKKYKLIKKYPTSPKTGTIIQDAGNNQWYIGETKKLTEYAPRIIGMKPAEYPEFWEEVKEKDYEILEIDGYSGHYILNPTTGFMTYKGQGIGSYTAEYYLNSKYPHHIHSIKRLSDGEVFTIGDKIQNFIEEHNIINTIVTFKRTENSLWISVGKRAGCLLDKAIKAKLPLFITEDKVDVYEGDTCVEVRLDNYNLHEYRCWQKYYGENGIPLIGKLMFSTKEAAERWIDENKPKYSKKDIGRMVNSLAEELYQEIRDYRNVDRISLESFGLTKLINLIYNDET